MDKSLSFVLLIVKKIFLIRMVLVLLIVLWSTFIFIMSSQTAVQSSQTSSELVLKIIDIFYHDFKALSSNQQMQITNAFTLIVRKLAHFFEYFILGLLSSGVAFTYSGKKQCLYLIGAMVFCAMYAISDEIHQYFVPGRACRWLDICIDSVGSICAIAITTLIVSVYIRHKSGEINAKKEIN